MSIHSEIPVNSPEGKFLESLCDTRWEKMKDPCKGCKYRYPIENPRGVVYFRHYQKIGVTLNSKKRTNSLRASPLLFR